MSGTSEANPPLMRSVLHRAHVEAGARFEQRGGWLVPAAYGSGTEGLDGLSTGLAYADVSAQSKVQLNGSVAALVRSVAGKDVGSGSLAPIGGGGVLARIARDWALALVPAVVKAGRMQELDDQVTGDALATDVTSAFSGFLVAGARVGDFLSRSVALDMTGLRPGSCLATAWSRVPAVILVRDLPLRAVEIYVSADYGRYAWRRIGELSQRLGGEAVGWNALDRMGWP